MKTLKWSVIVLFVMKLWNFLNWAIATNAETFSTGVVVVGGKIANMYVIYVITEAMEVKHDTTSSN